MEGTELNSSEIRVLRVNCNNNRGKTLECLDRTSDAKDACVICYFCCDVPGVSHFSVQCDSTVLCAGTRK